MGTIKPAVMKSGRFSWTKTDFTRGLLMAIVAAFLAAIGKSLGLNLDAPGDIFNLHFPTVSEWLFAAKAAITAAIAYIVKNYFTATNLQAVKTLQKATDAPIVINPQTEVPNNKP